MIKQRKRQLGCVQSNRHAHAKGKQKRKEADDVKKIRVDQEKSEASLTMNYVRFWSRGCRRLCV